MPIWTVIIGEAIFIPESSPPTYKNIDVDIFQNRFRGKAHRYYSAFRKKNEYV